MREGGYRQLFFLLLFLSILTTIYIKYAESIQYITQKIYTDSSSTEEDMSKTQKVEMEWGPDFQCYNSPQVDKSIPVVPGYEVLPNSIFFVETSCQHSLKLNLTKRQACVYESAARANLNSEVLVLFPSPISLNDPDSLISQLLKYPNIKLLHIDIDKFFADTPLENFNPRERLMESKWPVIHMSDVLRVLTLWRYGGTYMDWDFISFRSFDKMENYAGAAREDAFNNAVLNFGNNGTGRQIIDEIVLNLRDNFRGDIWDHNGPLLITRVLSRICNESSTLKMTPEKCSGFTVFPPPPNSPIYPTEATYEAAQSLMNRTLSEDIVSALSRSFGFHMTNSATGGTPVKRGSRELYDVLASWFCPQVYSVFGDSF